MTRSDVDKYRQHGRSAHAVLRRLRIKKRLIAMMGIALAGMALIATGLVYGLSQELLVREYTVKTEKVDSSFTIAHISDLHETPYGENQSELICAIEGMNPDVIFMTGDMADGYRDETSLRQLIEQIAGEYPCFYITGNHEGWTGRADEYASYFEESGVKVLRGTGERIAIGDAVIDIFGVDDPDVCTDEVWRTQLADCRGQVKEDVFSILLSHRPERVKDYAGFDLVLAGHAHGGQVRIPYIVNGLYAPNQGWFPEYAGGRYEREDGSMIVSRGLQINELPRIFNRPELVKIVICPE